MDGLYLAPDWPWMPFGWGWWLLESFSVWLVPSVIAAVVGIHLASKKVGHDIAVHFTTQFPKDTAPRISSVTLINRKDRAEIVFDIHVVLKVRCESS
jgi:hypothetical protein